MAGWRRTLAKGASVAEERFDALRFGLKARFGLLDPFEVLPYRGHGTRTELFLKGRVLEERGITHAGQRRPAWRNALEMAKRFASDEVPGARVRASFRGLEAEAVADAEGFFDFHFRLSEPLQDNVEWHPVELELVSPPSPGKGPVRSTGQVLVPAGARFGVISDIDDTVVRSSATNALKMAWILFLNSPETRLPFEGVARFYEALRRGPEGDERNPIFYVSSSPWNIYDVLEDFMDVHQVPVGPIFLKDWSPTVLGKHDKHKSGLIGTLLATYPELPFVLVGDSGQRDPEIYREVVRQHPGRIRAIYVRDVAGAERDAEVRAIAEEVRHLGSEMVLAADTARAAEHAASIGLISADEVPPVRARS